MLWMLLTFSSYAFDFIATCERVSFAMHDEESGVKKNMIGKQVRSTLKESICWMRPKHKTEMNIPV